MSCILQRISDAYQRNPAEVLSLLPELMDAVKAGEVIELPCKVGDIVYVDDPFYIAPWEIQHIGITIECDGWERRFSLDEIGKTVFLTRKEAEKAIERNGGKS
jgi:hypothetical protein